MVASMAHYSAVLKDAHKVECWDDRWAEQLGFVMADSSAYLMVDERADCFARLKVGC